MSGKNRKRHNPKEIVQKLGEADRLLHAGQSVCNPPRPARV